MSLYLGIAKPRVLIDAGHGGSQLGAMGICGIFEKNITLKIAIRVSDILQMTHLADTDLVRTSDLDLSLEERLATIGLNKSSLLLSIHANWSPSQDSNGIEIYASTPQGISHEESRHFAHVMQQSFSDYLTNQGRGELQAPFLILQHASIPAILVEVGFLSNPEDCQQLLNPQHIEKISATLARGVLAYLNVKGS